MTAPPVTGGAVPLLSDGDYKNSMEHFTFIEIFIHSFFSNPGLRSYFVYILGAFGVAICVRVASIMIPKVFNKWD